MKKGIHSEYVEAKVKCGYGNEFTTRSTLAKINMEICSACHPFHISTQKYVDKKGNNSLAASIPTFLGGALKGGGKP